MLTEARDWWEKHAQQYQRQSQTPIDILYGPGSPNEDRLQLIGDVRGKTVLEIGCGAAQATIALAQRVATVTALDVAESSLQLARELAATHHVAIRFLQADMANLSGIAAASQDVVFPACAVAYADDLPACFAEVKRVLIPGGLFLLSVGHPFQYAVDSQALALHRSYFDTGPHVEGDGKGGLLRVILPNRRRLLQCAGGGRLRSGGGGGVRHRLGWREGSAPRRSFAARVAGGGREALAAVASALCRSDAAAGYSRTRRQSGVTTDGGA